MGSLRELADQLNLDEEQIRVGGGAAADERQRRLGRLPVRQRLAELLDRDAPFWELGLWAAHGMYSEWGDVPAAGLVTGIGLVAGRACLVAANDPSVKAGAMFPQSIKKLLRAQRIAMAFRLPVLYLVDSAGVFLPLQDEVFPDEDDFGRIFRNNAVMSAAGIPQFAAVLGNCIAGGAYLPVLCDTLLMTEGSQMSLAGAALVKAAIGQTVEPEELGGARMHATISGTADFRDPDDASCLRRLRSLVSMLPERGARLASPDEFPTERPLDDLYSIVPADGRGEYDGRDVVACLVDRGSIQEYKAEYGQTVVTSFARIGRHPVGIVANQRRRQHSAQNELQIGGVLYADAAEKAARFVMDCNQASIPLVFLQDVQGFMVGRQAEQSGIIRSGAKLVNVVSNSVVPKFTIVLRGSFGAGNYALCGKAYDPWLIAAWPGAQFAVMGGAQAAETLLSLRVRDAERSGKKLGAEELAELRASVSRRYQEQTEIRFGAARGWVDAILRPDATRQWLRMALELAPRRVGDAFQTGVLQV